MDRVGSGRWLPGRPGHERWGYGIVGDIVLGIIGAVLGGWLSSTLLGIDVNGFNPISVLMAFIGACIVIAISRMVRGRRTAV